MSFIPIFSTWHKRDLFDQSTNHMTNDSNALPRELHTQSGPAQWTIASLVSSYIPHSSIPPLYENNKHISSVFLKRYKPYSPILTSSNTNDTSHSLIRYSIIACLPRKKESIFSLNPQNLKAKRRPSDTNQIYPGKVL